MADYYATPNIPLPADPAEILVGGDTIGGTGVVDWCYQDGIIPPVIPPPHHTHDISPPRPEPHFPKPDETKPKKKSRRRGSGATTNGIIIFVSIIIILFLIGWLSSRPSAPESITFQ